MWFKKKVFNLEDLNKDISNKIKKLSKKYDDKKGVEFSEIASDYASLKVVLFIVEDIVNNELRNDEHWGKVIQDIDKGLDNIEGVNKNDAERYIM
jgi:hypothetical protein